MREFDFCPDGRKHVLTLSEEWKNDRWYAWGECSLCGFRYGTNIKGCDKKLDKQHDMVDGSFIKDGVKFITRKCDSCGMYMQRPETIV